MSDEKLNEYFVRDCKTFAKNFAAEMKIKGVETATITFILEQDVVVKGDAEINCKITYAKPHKFDLVFDYNMDAHPLPVTESHGVQKL